MNTNLDVAARLDPIRQLLSAQPLQGTRLPPALVNAIRTQGLWKLWVPRCFGGEELDLPSSLALFEAAAALDGSVGFALAIGTGGGLFGAYLPTAVARTIFSPPDALIAGSGAPSGIATPVDDAFRVRGTWRYASLIHDATWVTANVRRTDTGAIMAVAVPRAAVEIVPDWDVHALRATDSHSVHMTEITVPADNTFTLDRSPCIDTDLYRFPFAAIAAASFAAVTVGIARGAIEAFAAAQEQRGTADASSRDVRTERLKRAVALQRQAWSKLTRRVTDAWGEIGRRSALDARTEQDLRRTACASTARAVDAVELLARVAGMSLLEAQDRFSRAWRDAHGMAQHALISETAAASFG